MPTKRSTTDRTVPIRLGIIGCGAIVRAQHIPAIRAAGQFNLVAVADHSPEAAADAVVAWLGIPIDREDNTHRRHPDVHAFMERRWWPDHKGLLEGSGVEAVLIATPNNTHEAIARDCLAAGIHVFCEKPVAFTIEAHDELDRMASEKGLAFQVGLVLRYSAVFRHVRSLVEKEPTGTPLMMFINEFRPFPQPTTHGGIP